MDKQPAQDLLLEAYEQWIKHPITHELIKVLNKHKQAFVERISISAGNGDADSLRSAACGIRDIDTIIKFINNYEAFKTQINKT